MTDKFKSQIISPMQLLDDPLADMVFITRFTGMTGKGFYKLISESVFQTSTRQVMGTMLVDELKSTNIYSQTFNVERNRHRRKRGEWLCVFYNRPQLT